MPLDTGLMDREITLQFATTSSDPTTNQQIQSWDDEVTVRAQWLPQGAREVWQARQIDATIEGVYKVHYREDVTPDAARIVGHDGRVFDLRGVTEIGRKEGLLIGVVARAEAAA